MRGGVVYRIASCSTTAVYAPWLCARATPRKPNNALKSHTCSLLNLASTASSPNTSPAPARSPDVAAAIAVLQQPLAPIAAWTAVLSAVLGHDTAAGETKAVQECLANMHDTSKREPSRPTVVTAPRIVFMALPTVTCVTAADQLLLLLC